MLQSIPCRVLLDFQKELEIQCKCQIFSVFTTRKWVVWTIPIRWLPIFDQQFWVKNDTFYFGLMFCLFCVWLLGVYTLIYNPVEGQKMDQLEFTRAIVKQMLSAHQSRPQGGPSGSQLVSSKTLHISSPVTKQGRCKLCRKNTTRSCDACGIFLHDRCMEEFHK